MGSEALRSVADYTVSNVDKLVSKDETPVRLCNYTDVYHNEYITLDLKFMRATASRDEIARFGLSVDDVVITKDSESWDDIGVPALVRETTDDLVCGYHLALLRPRKRVMAGSFLFRCLQAAPVRLQLELSANGVTRFGLSKSEIGATTLPVPPLSQQRAIADYLDQETERLDALVAAKERVLKLLFEKCEALIVRAVTRGIDPSVSYRDSGIPWLGDIPTHWAVRMIARLFREYDERGQPDLPLLEVSIERGVVIREFSSERIESTAANFNTYKVARQGDIVFNKMRMWQGAVGAAPEDGLVSPDYVVARPTGCLSAEYASLLFRTPAFSAESARNSHGIVWDRLRLYWQGFRDIAVPVPPVREQQEIVERIQQEKRTLDELSTATSRTIALLQERRAALIAAAVTGRIDVECAA